MKRFIGLTHVIALGLLISPVVSSTKSAPLPLKSSAASEIAINLISGQVWDPFGNPLSDIYVELQNELMMTVARQRTMSGGRFEFSNISSGSYKVRVLTGGTDYLEQIIDVQIINVFQGASDQQHVDFHLKFDPRKVNLGSGGVPEEVFVQEIPDQARKHYRKGLDLLIDKKTADKGIGEMEQAIGIFPEYYDALSRLGREYVRRTEYEKSLPHLIKAIEVNRRSYSGFYNLAYACYKLGHKSEAVEAARGAAVIKPDSIDAQILYGTTLRINGNYQQAIQVLTKAKDLTKKKPIAEIHYQLALALNRMNRNKEAAAELETYLKLLPNSPNKKEIEDLIGKLKNDTAKS